MSTKQLQRDITELCDLVREDSYTWLDHPEKYRRGPRPQQVNPRWQRMRDRRRRIEVLRYRVREATSGTLQRPGVGSSDSVKRSRLAS